MCVFYVRIIYIYVSDEYVCVCMWIYVFCFCLRCFSLYDSNNLSPSSHSFLVDIISRHILFFPDTIRKWDIHQGSSVLSVIKLLHQYSFISCCGCSALWLYCKQLLKRREWNFLGIRRKGEIVLSAHLCTLMRRVLLSFHIYFSFLTSTSVTTYFTKGTASEEVCGEDIRRGNEEHGVPRQRDCAAGVRTCSESGW